QEHCELVALDRRRSRLHRRLRLQGPAAYRRPFGHPRGACNPWSPRWAPSRDEESDRSLYNIAQRLPINIAPEFVGGNLHTSTRKLRTRSADMRGNEQVRAGPERMANRQRLGVGDVECCP